MDIKEQVDELLKPFMEGGAFHGIVVEHKVYPMEVVITGPLTIYCVCSDWVTESRNGQVKRSSISEYLSNNGIVKEWRVAIGKIADLFKPSSPEPEENWQELFESEYQKHITFRKAAAEWRLKYSDMKKKYEEKRDDCLKLSERNASLLNTINNYSDTVEEQDRRIDEATSTIQSLTQQLKPSTSEQDHEAEINRLLLKLDESQNRFHKTQSRLEHYIALFERESLKNLESVQ